MTVSILGHKYNHVANRKTHIILILGVDQLMSQVVEPSSQNQRDFLQPTHQLQTSLG